MLSFESKIHWMVKGTSVYMIRWSIEPRFQLIDNEGNYIWASVFAYHLQHCNSFRRFCLRDIVCSAWHLRTCVVSSSGRLQIGQFDNSLFFLCTITFPVAVSPLIHFERHIFVDNLASFLAFVRTCQCTVWCKINVVLLRRMANPATNLEWRMV